jgi:hypothetical protein
MLTGDPTLRWIVTAVFGVGIATYSYILVAQRARWTSTVNHLLHLTMSAAMIGRHGADVRRAVVDTGLASPMH